MQEKSTFSLVVEEIIKNEGVTLQKIANKLNIRYATLHSQVRVHGNPRFEVLLKVMHAYPGYISMLFDLDKIPKQIKK